MKRYVGLICILFLFGSKGLEAQGQITLEEIFRNRTFTPRYVPGFNFQKDGKHYTRLVDNRIVQYDLTTGEETEVLFDIKEIKDSGLTGIDGYTFSEAEDKILIKTETERIYRHSTRANFYVWDRNSATLSEISRKGKQRYATFSPDAGQVAFVRENDLYYKDLTSGNEVRITADGKFNEVINGATDWVYEEEFALSQAFEWSPDGKKIAFLRFDERAVKEFTMTMHRDALYPEYVSFKYPKVGEKNAVVSVHIYDLKRGEVARVKTGKKGDIYFPRIKWTKDPNLLCVFRMNRHQNELELLLAQAQTGDVGVLLKEENPAYIDVDDDLTFLENGKQFIWTSEQSGFNHIYLYGMDGKLVRQLTQGDFDVTAFYGVDEKNGQMYYQSAEASPLERHVYVQGLERGKARRLTPKKGWSSAQFSSTFDYFVNTHSDANTPAVYTVLNAEGKEVRQIEDNLTLRRNMEVFGMTALKFFSFTTSEQVELNGWMIKPPDFDPARQYPVLMYVYGGPGSQTVTDRLSGRNYAWFQLLAQKGYIVASIDNRGTGGRGQDFKKLTYLNLGKYETIDQIEAATYLGSLPYVDAGRIGIFGWSYGGYMSSLCIFKGNDVFKAAIAVAPVTNWKWYDTIYTERYMRTETENPLGYKENSPVYFADRLKGNYLLAHGMADDNVHFQHTAEMANALIGANKQFDTYFYPNRNHGIYGNNATLHLYTKMTNFILERL